MNKIEEKFSKFSHMVMKEADARKKEIISEAEKLRSQTISENENVLKNAYDKIRDSMLKVEKEHNEEISKLFYRASSSLPP